jgi:hypothetical protein
MKYFVDETEFTEDEFREYLGDELTDRIKVVIIKAQMDGPVSQVEYYPDTDVIIVRLFHNQLHHTTCVVVQKELL